MLRQAKVPILKNGPVVPQICEQMRFESKQVITNKTTSESADHRTDAAVMLTPHEAELVGYYGKSCMS